jgi:TorA maturation chaperone TorD
MTAEPLAAEDQARANFYALLARLFYAPPERELLDLLAHTDAIASDDSETALASGCRELARGASSAEPDAVREEYESLFVGTGRAEITLYTGAYTLKGALDNPLVDIRDFLAAQGLERGQSVHEPEDHVAALCEVMRHLVVRGDAAVQREFFAGYLSSAGPVLCDAIINHQRSGFYRHVARLAKTFFELELAAFDME